MKKILVTGGTGFIGSSIVNDLIKNYKVSVIDNNSRGNIKRLNIHNKNLKYFKADIRDKKKVYFLKDTMYCSSGIYKWYKVFLYKAKFWM